jgi:hypothetical protein
MDTTTHHHPGTGERSLLGLFADLWRQTSTLIHDEVALARAEISEKASQVGSGVAAVATGGAIAFAGFLVLLLAAVAALMRVLPEAYALWLSPLIVGASVMIVGFLVLAGGRRELSANSLKPERTIESVRRDARLAKEHMP